MSKANRVDQNLFVFYEQALNNFKSMNKTDEDKEGREILLENTFSTLEREGLHVCSHPGISRIVEEFLKFADVQCTLKLLNSFSENWSKVVTNKFSHHVLETVMMKCQILLAEKNAPKELRLHCEQLCEHIWENYSEYLQQKHGSFILRAYLRLMAGVQTTKMENAGSLEILKATESIPVDPQWKDHLTDLTNRFLLSNQLLGILEDELAGPVVQVLLVVISVRMKENFDKICRHLLKKSQLMKLPGETATLGEETHELPNAMTHISCSFFTEHLVSVLSPKLLRKFVKRHVRGKEPYLAVHPRASRVLQRVLMRSDTAEQLCSNLAPLEPHLGAIVAAGQHGVLLAFVEKCLQLPGLQDAFIKSLRRGFHCNETNRDDIFFCLVSLKSRENVFDETGGFDMVLPGTLLVQRLVDFKQPNPLIAGLVNGPIKRLTAVCNNQSGSHVMEAILKSPNVTRSRKMEIVAKIKDVCCDIACNKHGSRVLDAVWASGDLAIREEVTAALVPAINRIRSDTYGRFIFYKFAPLIYSRNRKDWLRLHETSSDGKKPSSLGQADTQGNRHNKKRNRGDNLQEKKGQVKKQRF